MEERRVRLVSGEREWAFVMFDSLVRSLDAAKKVKGINIIKKPLHSRSCIDGTLSI